MDKGLTIHEKYQRDCDELLQQQLCGVIGVQEWARKDRALKGAYLYECLRTGDQGCNALLARMESNSRVCA